MDVWGGSMCFPRNMWVLNMIPIWSGGTHSVSQPKNSSRTSNSGISANVAGGAEEGGGGGAMICGAHGAEGGTCML